MSEFAKQYAQFRLTTEQCENLRRFAEPGLYLTRMADCVIIETVIIENGERRVIKKEELSVKLV